MGKSVKLLKSFVTGVNVFKSPSKERHAKDSRDHVKKRNKDRCFGSLGKSSSRNHGAMSATAESPEAIEIKCVQVESEKLKEALPEPVAESFGADPLAGNKVAATREGALCGNGFIQPSQPDSKEQVIIPDYEKESAAVKIQAAFRCYLAQRAFQALRALVRLQALARGRLVRRRAAASLRCVRALIRVQALARGRRVRNSELGQLLQKHLQQTKHSRKKSSDGWVTGTGSALQSHGKGHVNKHDSATKRQRALVYTYSEQLSRRSKKDGPSPGIDSKVNKSHWAWEWLELWTAATLEGGSIALNPVEDCAPVLKNPEKAKAGIKGIKHSEISRKDGRKVGEHAESTLPTSQRGPSSGEHEAASVSKEEEEFKAFPVSEKLRNASLSEEKPASMPPPPNPPPPPVKAGIAYGAREISQPDMQSSPIKMVSDVPILSQRATEAIQPLSPSSDLCFSGTNAINHPSGANTLWSPNHSATSCPEAASYVSPSSTMVGAANGHTVSPTKDLFQMWSDSPSKDCRESSLALSLFSPEESCITSELRSMDPPSEVIMSSPEVASGSTDNELCLDGLLSRTPKSLDAEQARGTNVYNTDNVANEENGDKVVVLTDNTDDMQEPGMIQVDAQNDESTHQSDNSLGTNGECDAMMVSTGATSMEVPGKSPNGVGLKHEQTECISPSIPSYMATTMSAKAKIRSHTSPKQRADLVKQKLESPKPKSNSPQTKGDSPSQKPNSATKRRYSLSALDGKVSMAIQNQRPASHMRTSSRGNFSSMKDLSVDNFTVSNGDSRRHGK